MQHTCLYTVNDKSLFIHIPSDVAIHIFSNNLTFTYRVWFSDGKSSCQQKFCLIFIMYPIVAYYSST